MKDCMARCFWIGMGIGAKLNYAHDARRETHLKCPCQDAAESEMTLFDVWRKKL
jgi:hypothetical protein